MNRRNFITRTGLGAVGLPLVLQGIPLKAYDGPKLQQLFNTTEESDRVLVLVQLNGGNDGLNTVIPLDQYDTYARIRPGVAIPEAAALRLANHDHSALHPALEKLGELYAEQKLGVVHGVNYPNPDQSHFRSNDIWMSGSDANGSEPTGWLGRYLNTLYPGYPEGYPNTAMPDPVAIQMSAVVSLLLVGKERQSMGMALQDPETFYNLVSGTEAPGTDLPSSAYARQNVEYVRQIQLKSMDYSTVIKAAADKATNQVVYPEANRLADQLAIVARLIAGGLKTRAYVVTLNGFDTHAAQVDESDPTMGAHAGLLRLVSEALSAFQRDLEAQKIDHRVVTMSFSEFGRRPYSNLSYGTDHGTAAPMFFMGTPVQDGVTSTTPDLEDLDNQNMKIRFDFRQIYASVLEQWFGASPQDIQDVLARPFETIRVIKGSPTTVSSQPQQNGTTVLHPVAPNPVRTEATIRYAVNESCDLRIDLFDALGIHVTTITHGHHDSGRYEAGITVNTLPSGSYYVRLSSAQGQVVQPLVVTR